MTVCLYIIHCRTCCVFVSTEDLFFRYSVYYFLKIIAPRYLQPTSRLLNIFKFLFLIKILCIGTYKRENVTKITAFVFRTMYLKMFTSC